MPKLNFSREHDEHTIKQIDLEIDKWKKVFTNGNIMRCHYETEKELEQDWFQYMSQSYEHKCLANSMAYRFYGLKNEEIYHKFKHYFITHDIVQDKSDAIKVYAPKKLLNEGTTYKDQEAEDVYNTTGYYVITNKNDSSQDLINQLQRFRSMSHDKKVKADTYSIKIYGKTNEERYTDMIPKLLSQENIEDDDDDFSEEIPYRPGNYYIDESNITKYERTRELVDDDNVSITEAIFITEDALNAEPISVIEDTIADNLVDHLNNKIKRSRNENYLGYTTPYLLPHEIIRLTAGKPLSKDKFATNWLVDYQSKLLGAKPRKPINSMEWKYEVTKAIEDNNENRIISLGWNPSIPFNEETLVAAGKRTNSIIRNNIGYDFVDLSEMTLRMPINEDKSMQSKRGIYLVFNRDPETNRNIPRVLVSHNSSLHGLHAVIQLNRYPHFGFRPYHGDIKKDMSLIDVYALILPDEVKHNMASVISTISAESDAPNAPYFDYSNAHMFCITAYNTMLNVISITNHDCSITDSKYYKKLPHHARSYANLRASGKDYIYKIYSGKASNYYSSQINNLINYKPISNINEESSYFPYICIQPLRGSITSVSPELYNDANAFLAEYQKRPIDYITANALINDSQLEFMSSLTYGQIENKLLKMMFVQNSLDKPFSPLQELIDRLKDKLKSSAMFQYLDTAYIESPYNRMVLHITRVN